MYEKDFAKEILNNNMTDREKVWYYLQEANNDFDLFLEDTLSKEEETEEYLKINEYYDIIFNVMKKIRLNIINNILTGLTDNLKTTTIHQNCLIETGKKIILAEEDKKSIIYFYVDIFPVGHILKDGRESKTPAIVVSLFNDEETYINAKIADYFEKENFKEDFKQINDDGDWEDFNDGYLLASKTIPVNSMEDFYNIDILKKAINFMRDKISIAIKLSK